MKGTGLISRIARIHRGVQGYRFITLLASLLLLFFIAAVGYMLEDPGRRRLAGFAVAVLFNLMLLSAVNAISQTRRTMVTAISLVVPAGLLSLVAAAWKSDAVLVLNNLFSIAFIALVVILVFDFLFRSETVDANMICASLCVYLLLGFIWASLYSLCAVFRPDSFVYAYADEFKQASMVFGGEKSLVPLYYSFVTLTTLGYGDIVPVSPPAKILAVLEAVIGQIYLTVLVARLVGLHIAHITSEPSDKSP